MEDPGCRICSELHATEDCPVVKSAKRVGDAVSLPKAFHTLPDSLGWRKKDGLYDIYAKTDLHKGTQFGPFIAPKDSKRGVGSGNPLPIFQDKKVIQYLDRSDLDKCNWMGLVRFEGSDQDPPANLICYQLKNEIYFSAVENVGKGDSLVVSYSRGYAVLIEEAERQEEKKDVDHNYAPKSSQSVLTGVRTPTSSGSDTSSIPASNVGKIEMSETAPIRSKQIHGTRARGQQSRSRKLESEQIVKPQQEKPSFICEVCGAIYSNVRSLRSHFSVHNGRPFACDKCGKRFNRKELLIIHKYVHREAEFGCSTCGKVLKSQKSLQVHQRIHSLFRPYVCETCGKGFTQKINLKSHATTHLSKNEKKTIKCQHPNCEKVFSGSQYLRRHAESHKDGNRYSCNTCSSQFIKPHLLHRHQLMVHGNDVYRCEFCRDSRAEFRYKHSLQRHLSKEHVDQHVVWSRPGYISQTRCTREFAIPRLPGKRGGQKKQPAKKSSGVIVSPSQNISPTSQHIIHLEIDSRSLVDSDSELIVHPANDTDADDKMPEDLIIETEVEVGTDQQGNTIRLEEENEDDSLIREDNMMVLQLADDDTKHYVIAFSQQPS